MRVAFVVQRCGRDVIGGAESLCLQVAQHLSKHWEVEILTTCALDYMTWENYYPAGLEFLGDVPVRRFATDHVRDVAQFNACSESLLSQRGAATKSEQEHWMQAQGPMSSSLLEYLYNRKTLYDAFLFFGYLYATTYFGLPLVRERALLVPLAHDEWTMEFSIWDDLFRLPRGFLFQTLEERQFLSARFPDIDLAGPIAGVGVERPETLDPSSFRDRYDLRSPFLLYAGRIDESKGCAEMIKEFVRLRDARLIDYRLVLIGQEVMPVPYHPDVMYLGVVAEQEKWNALSACDWSLLPSRYESLSLSLLESWSVGRPGLVTSQSEVLVGHCRRGNGGLWYQDWVELAFLLQTISPAVRDALGKAGQRYVELHYTWARIEKVYIEVVSNRFS